MVVHWMPSSTTHCCRHCAREAKLLQSSNPPFSYTNNVESLLYTSSMSTSVHILEFCF